MIERKGLINSMPSYAGWYMLQSLGLLSIWKTPTKYCLDMPYYRHCEFFGSMEEARSRAYELLNKYEPGLFQTKKVTHKI